MRNTSLAVLALALLAALGCQTTGRDILSVPVAREYAQLEPVDLGVAQAKVEEARKLGAAAHAPYEYFSAVHYLDIAQQERRRRNRQGVWDYAGLAVKMADVAIEAIPEEERVPSAIERAADEAAARSEFDRVKARYLEIDPAKAKETMPLFYAQATTRLSLAEYALEQGKNWREAAQALLEADALIDTMWHRDAEAGRVAGLPDIMPDTDERDDVAEDEAEEYPALDPILFARGSTTVSAADKGYLRGLAHLLAESADIMLHVKGYTDDSHSVSYNLDLSRRRAQAVRQLLLEYGISEDRLIVSFHGDANPVADNTTAAGRALNRRVEIILD